MIKDLKTLRKFFREKVNTPIFGVGVYAFNRLGPEDFIPQYQLLALYDSLDTCLIEKDIPVFSLEREMGEKIRWQVKRNSTSVIGHFKVKQYLAKHSFPLLLPYKSSSEMILTCQKNDWQLAANPPDLDKKSIDNKVKFRRILEVIGAPCPPGEIAFLGQLDFDSLAQKYNLPFVIQYPLSGGGKGTFFIKTAKDLRKARESLIALTKGEIDDNQEMIVSQFIKGPSPSVTGCVTRQGILSTSPQYQVLSMPELNNRSGAGLFCGHDWSFSHFSPYVCRQVYEITEMVGQYLQKIGYKGIFGLDFIMDERTEKVYVVECNPRLLGSFPTLTMAQISNGEPPILAFHILEFLNANYQIDTKAINQQMRMQRKGAQMLLHNLVNNQVQVSKKMRPGIYRLNNDQEMIFIRDGYKLSHLKKEKEFLITEGILDKGAYFTPSGRIGRILTLTPVLADYQHLNSWAKKIVVRTTQGLGLRPVHFWRLKRLFNPRLRK
ncbi:hypothetical protein COT63_00130 [Candidatus Shapirobacteria bacterium CG09_land_8_20_14_0_10_38_17]|uniref:ATP-grasp domain-containing protein n=1 Tax=Candidatus Shapirobacteria bacterium CG09_land_8_20_14_0_10_38_17 TaxID=1974884 RepID=A0A2H0WRV8_9BACT|nr:MAG: hypothetical protein COT63_00130 [Candidatus Shapirobacteria bacterium CG09_land_8_20_14_0_10_38_17]